MSKRSEKRVSVESKAPSYPPILVFTFDEDAQPPAGKSPWIIAAVAAQPSSPKENAILIGRAPAPAPQMVLFKSSSTATK
jgi:hypothetical protein